MSVLNAEHGERLKREGQQLALDFSGPWSQAALLEFRGWLAIQRARGEREITVEQFRSQARHQPERHFAWGAFPKIAMAAGLIAPKWVVPGVQARVRAAAPKTHAHEVKVWSIL